MVKGNKRKILSLLLVFSLMFSVFAVNVTASTNALNDNISTSEFPLNSYEKDLIQELSIDSRISIKYTDFPLSKVDFAPEFKLAAASDVNLSLVVASYDSQNRLVKSAVVDKKLIAGENATIQATVPYAEGLTYKYFIWDDKYVPLASGAAPRMLTDDEVAIKLVSIEDTMDILTYLSKGIGNRTRGTSGEERAVDYMLSEFGKLGLETEKHQFTASSAAQNFAYITIHDPEKFYGLGTFDNGRGGPYMQWHGEVWQAGAAANGVITGTGSAISAEVVFVGTAGVSPTQAAFNAVDLEGKIALIGVTANATMVTYARNAGAVGLMGFSTALGGRGNHSQAANPSVTAGTAIPVMGLARCQGEWMMAMIKKDKVLVDIQTVRIPTPYSWNAIGIKPAKNNPDTAPIFMVTGHIDSVMGSPGGNDDGSGSAVVLEAARALSKLDTDNVELRFVTFGHEESGLRGSTQYVARLSTAERARVKGVFQMDMTGTPDERANVWCMMTTNGQANLVTTTFLATASRLGYGSTVELGQFSSSDHVPFANAGMAAAMGMWFGRPAGYTGQINPSNYVIESVYHTPLDTIEDNVSVERMKMCIEVATAAVYDMALNYVAPPIAIAPLFTRFAAPTAEDPYQYILTGDYIDKQLAKLAAEEAAAAEAAYLAEINAETER